MVDKQVTKLTAKINEISAQLRQAGMSILNLRQMYEGAVQEKMALRQQLEQAQILLVASVLSNRKKTLTITKKVLESVADYHGINVSEGDGDVILTAIAKSEAPEPEQEDEGV